MIKKVRKPPLKLQKIEALLRRLPQNHPKRPNIQEDIAKLTAGYKGEESLNYYLDSLPKNEYYLFHDLRLTNDQQYYFKSTPLLSPLIFS